MLRPFAPARPAAPHLTPEPSSWGARGASSCSGSSSSAVAVVARPPASRAARASTSRVSPAVAEAMGPGSGGGARRGYAVLHSGPSGVAASGLALHSSRPVVANTQRHSLRGPPRTPAAFMPGAHSSHTPSGLSGGVPPTRELLTHTPSGLGGGGTVHRETGRAHASDTPAGLKGGGTVHRGAGGPPTQEQLRAVATRFLESDSDATTLNEYDL